MLSLKEYQNEINEMAQDIWREALERSDNDEEDARELINDTIHERVDGHQWVIYTHYHFDVLGHASDKDAYQDIYCDQMAGEYLANNGIDALTALVAFYAIKSDIIDVIYEQLEKRAN